MKITVARDTFTPLSTGGKVSLDGVFFCYCLEPPKVGDGAVCIPPGTYPGRIYQSPKWTERRGYPFLVVLLQGIPGRSEIEIHIGNTPSDTLGCILLGQLRTKDGVGYSEEAFFRFMHRVFGSTDTSLLTVEVAEPAK